MKILHITAQKPFKTGSGIYVHNTIKEFDKRSYRQAIIAGISIDDKISINTNITLEQYPVYFNTKKIPFSVVGMSNVMPYKSTRYKDLDKNMIDSFIEGFTMQIDRAIRRFNPDIIICHHLYILTALTRSLVKNKIVIGVCHGTDLRQLDSISLKKEFVKENIRKLDGVLALHDNQKEAIKECFNINENNIYVTGSGYDDSIFYSKTSYKKNEEIRIIYAGKISYSKGLIPLIQAFKSLNISSNAVKLSLAGMGNGREYNEILDVAKNTKHEIEFLGNLTQEELAEEFRKSHIFILPSFYEGLPLVIIEALASGLHVITSEILGIKQWLGEEINNSGRISYIPLPRLKEVDIPLEEDLPRFKRNIKEEIQLAIGNIYKNKLNKNNNLKHLSWAGLANRIERVIFNINGIPFSLIQNQNSSIITNKSV